MKTFVLASRDVRFRPDKAGWAVIEEMPASHDVLDELACHFWGEHGRFRRLRGIFYRTPGIACHGADHGDVSSSYVVSHARHVPRWMVRRAVLRIMRKYGVTGDLTHKDEWTVMNDWRESE